MVRKMVMRRRRVVVKTARDVGRVVDVVDIERNTAELPMIGAIQAPMDMSRRNGRWGELVFGMGLVVGWGGKVWGEILYSGYILT